MSRFKRAFDVVGACAGLLVFAPVIAIAAAAVYLERRLRRSPLARAASAGRP